MNYRILSIDGGGIRGILTAVLLARIEENIPGFLDEVDLFAGTSTGGLLALGLAAGKTPSEMIGIYKKFGSDVFARSFLDRLFSLWGLTGSKYSSRNLYDILTSEFGNLKLGDLRKNVLISTFNLDKKPKRRNDIRSWNAKFYHNFSDDNSDREEKLIDVAMRTASAPTYFPVYQGFIDGGVIANNPSVCALAQAINPSTGGQKLDEIYLFSLGNGNNPKFLEIRNNNMGLIQWAPQMITLMLEGGSGLADYQCEQLLGRRYLRINPVLPHSIPMDAVFDIPKLVEIADNYDLSGTLFWLNRYYLS